MIDPTKHRMLLPPIALDELPEHAKDFIIASANRDDCTPTEAIRKLLIKSAQRAGFKQQREIAQ